jgi:nucleoside-diphosphate-sugar epimerase
LLAALQKRIAVLPGRASARFSLIHVDDLAQVIVSAVSSNHVGLFELDDMEQGHSWANLAAINAENSGLPQHIIYLPKALAFLIAVFAEVGATILNLPEMLNREKVRELYHDDWVVRGENWPRSNAISLSMGLHETLKWYREQGLLPQLTQKNKSTA